MAKKQEWTATGRRKRSVARVRLVGGTGNITVNGVDVNDYMPYATLVMDLKQPLVSTGNENRFDIDINVKDMNIDMLSLSGHKLHAPKGVGALYVKTGINLPNLIYGGAQERNKRAGTENVPSIVALGCYH